MVIIMVMMKALNIKIDTLMMVIMKQINESAELEPLASGHMND